MDALTGIAIASALGGWGAFSYTLARLNAEDEQMESDRVERARLAYSLSLEEKQNELLIMAANVAGDELRATRKCNAALAAQNADITKQLIATRENLEEEITIREAATDLSVARYKQIEDLRAQLESIQNS